MKNKILFIMFALLLFINFVDASVPLKVTTSKDVYTLGDRIVIIADINNIFDKNVQVNVNTLITNDKGNNPLGILPNQFILNKNASKTIVIKNSSVDNSMKPGKYFVNVTLSFDNQIIDKQTVNFQIINTLNSFQSDLKFCKDIECTKESNVFVVGDTVYYSITSDTNGINISSWLIYPNQTKAIVNMPGNLIALTNGTYELDTTISKQGYKTVYKNEQFAIIEKQANINYVYYGNNNGNNNNNNSYNNPNNNNNPKKSNVWIYIIISLVMVIIIVILYILKIIFSRNIKP